MLVYNIIYRIKRIDYEYNNFSHGNIRGKHLPYRK